MANGKAAVKKQETKQETKQEVAKQHELWLPEAPADLAPGTGRGISTKPEDNLVPLVFVLHFLSPQCEERDARYIPGAKPGMIWLRNHPTNQLVSGEEGIVWQQCAFHVNWLEWVDRDAGGGLVARYDDIDGKPNCPTAQRDGKWTWRNGDNEIIQVRNHVGLVLGVGDQPLEPMPYVIPFKGAGHAVSKAWMTLTPKRRSDGQPADSFDFIWRITTQFKQNPKGKWYDFKPARLGFASKEQIAMGKALADSFATGEKQAADMADIGAAPAAEAEAF